MAPNTRVNGGTKDSYLELIKEHPLTSIKDGAQLTEAQHALGKLLAKGALNEGEEQYLDALSDLMTVYEDAHVWIPKASDEDVLRHLMEANNVNQKRVAAETGIAESTISSVLNGKRQLTRSHAAGLAAFFHVPASAFLP